MPKSYCNATKYALDTLSIQYICAMQFYFRTCRILATSVNKIQQN